MGDNLNLKLAEAYRAVAREMSALADILDQNEDTATDIKSVQKKRKRASDPNKPKAPLSAYLIYSNEKRDDVKNSMGLKADVREVMRVLASQWNGLNEAEKEPYIELARADKERFRAAMDEYSKAIQANGGAEIDSAAPAKATPTKAVSTKATPAKATPTKAVPTKATPTKAVKTKDTPKAQPTTLTESSSDKSDDSGSESEDSSSSESEDDSSSSDEEVTSKQPVKPKVAPAITAEKPKGSPKKAAIVDNTPKPTADIKSKAKVTKKEGQGDKQKSFKKAADKSGPLKKKFKKSV